MATMGHVGLMPQSISVLGGFRPQGQTAAEALRVMHQARVRAWRLQHEVRYTASHVKAYLLCGCSRTAACICHRECFSRFVDQLWLRLAAGPGMPCMHRACNKQTRREAIHVVGLKLSLVLVVDLSSNPLDV